MRSSGGRSPRLADFESAQLVPASMTWGQLEERLCAASARRGDPLLAFRLGRQLTESNLHLFGQLLVACRSMRQAIAYMHELQAHVTGTSAWRLTEEPETAYYSDHAAERGAATRQLIMAAGLGIADRFVGDHHQGWVVMRIASDAPDRALYREMFGDRVRVGEPGALFALSFPRALLDLPRPGTADESVALLLRDLALKRLPSPQYDGWVTRLEYALREQGQLASVDFGRIARRWSITARTLRRHIHAEGQTMTGVLNRIRFERAQFLLQDAQLTLADVAAQLGYSDPSSLQRAFKRWCGRSLDAFRRGR